MNQPDLCIDVQDLHAWYGESKVLHGVNLEVRRGEIVCLLGRNGAGRTTTLRAIMGVVDRKGHVKIEGRETVSMPSHQIARLGVGYCPEERGIYASLSCVENLQLLPKLGSGKITRTEIYEMFPNLAERASSQGTRLSGGEQQMLAIARILHAGADILLLDEISEGLAPVIVQRLAKLLLDLRARGCTILLVEQNFRFAAPLADRMYVLEEGRVVHELAADQLQQNADLLDRLLGV